MSFIPKAQEIYKHFKGNLYQVVSVAEHTETGELLVIYQAMYGDFKVYARPLEMFTSPVDKVKYPDVAQEFRFELQGPDAARQKAESGDVTARTETIAVCVTPEAVKAAEEPAVAELRSETQTEEELNIDPLVLEFLDADDYDAQLNVLTALHHRITPEMLTTMAIASDIEIEGNDTEAMYESLRNCLLMLKKYECSRMS